MYWQWSGQMLELIFLKVSNAQRLVHQHVTTWQQEHTGFWLPASGRLHAYTTCNVPGGMMSPYPCL